MEARHSESKQFTEDELLTIIHDIGEAIKVLHQQQPPIAHRDVKGNHQIFILIASFADPK
jgi:serine/threonine protein kinase